MEAVVTTVQQSSAMQALRVATTFMSRAQHDTGSQYVHARNSSLVLQIQELPSLLLALAAVGAPLLVRLREPLCSIGDKH
ncbi:hypothetical protein PK98_14780 [Croceibacterium mercuriale]|uniref:Uncharacterized protein n=1 Tax=Croceibacterium mercuriale TaxID=1572751 RepID=A0A0B2BWP8_9SPHN|nr:hypothetical protein PK98_14780 [Croceibacterium mercuriale]